jgi:CheY-like chemotaxis protein
VILVVDDDADLREALVAGLEREGHQVIAATDGERALQLLRWGIVPDVIMLDLMMPVMDGWEFRRQQLTDPTLAPIPVIVVSADPEARRLLGSPGVRAVLAKPVDFETLLGALDRAVSS